MKKKLAFILTACLFTGILAVHAAPNSGNPDEETEVTLEETTKIHEDETVHYPNATLQTAIEKYKQGNYIGCIQETLSLVKLNPSDAAAYYYMAISYAQIGDGGNALKAYNSAIDLNTIPVITDYAKVGKDCLINGPLCPVSASTAEGGEATEEESDLDKFINAPYGNGMSDEVNAQFLKKELENIQKDINQKEKLDRDDIQRIEDFDSRKILTPIYEEDENTDLDSSISDGTKIAMAEPSDEEILSAIKTLRSAGMTVNIQPTNQNPYSQNPEYMQQSAEMAQWNALMGNNNNTNNYMNMMPYFMNPDGSARKDINPQMIQTMLMSSSMMDFNFNSEEK